MIHTNPMVNLLRGRSVNGLKSTTAALSCGRHLNTPLLAVSINLFQNDSASMGDMWRSQRLAVALCKSETSIQLIAASASWRR